MRRSFIAFVMVLLLAAPLSAASAPGQVTKVLPQWLDLKGRHALSPSLYDRDAYQAQLRQHPEQRSAICFNVQWRARAAAGTKLALRVELRSMAQGNLPRHMTLEQTVKPGVFRRWTKLTLGGKDFQSFGEVTAWRATLWDGDRLLGEQKSFLW